MPIVNIKITRDGASPEQKAALIARSTEMMQAVLGKDPALTFVVIEEVEAENWGVAGLPANAFRAQGRTLSVS